MPDKLEEVLKLAGVGRKTATLFLADAYGIPGVTVDTHVFRISHRLGWAKGKNPLQVEQELMKVLPESHWNRINFQLIYLGRAICTARKARCQDCPLKEWCEKTYNAAVWLPGGRPNRCIQFMYGKGDRTAGIKWRVRRHPF